MRRNYFAVLNTSKRVETQAAHMHRQCICADCRPVLMGSTPLSTNNVTKH